MGNIIVKVVTFPANSTQAFTFTPTWGVPFSLINGQSNDSGPLAPDLYSVPQTTIPGWSTTSSQIPLFIDLISDPGITVTITFTNVQMNHITVEKVTSPSASPQSFDFTPSWGNPFSLTDGESNSTDGLSPGTYSVAETPVAGWTTATSQDPSALVLSVPVASSLILQSKTAILTDADPTLTFNNPVTAGSFLIAFGVLTGLPGDLGDVLSFTDPNNGTWVNQPCVRLLVPNLFIEPSVAGPAIAGATTVSVSFLFPGDTLVLFICELSGVALLDFIGGAVQGLSIPFLIPSGGHTDAVIAFGYGPGVGVGSESTLIDTLTSGGNTFVSEIQVVYPTPSARSTLTGSDPTNSEMVYLAFQIPGDEVSVTFTNTFGQTPTGTITVAKATVPSGSPQAFDFTPDYLAPFTLTDGQSNNSGDLNAGTYSIVETPVAGWSTMASQDPSAIVLNPGDNLTVTFTNTQLGRIIVKKVTQPSNSAQAFTFTPSWGVPFSLTNGQSHNSGPLAPGTYSVVETALGQWITTTSQDPSAIVLGAGETITITFTNTYIRPCFSPLWRSSQFSSTAFNAAYNVKPGKPLAWDVLGESPLQLRLMPPPVATGILEFLTVQTGPTLNPAAGVLLGILDMLSPAIKWGAMADLLSQEGEAQDLVRADYCRKRYQEFVEISRVSPAIIQAQIQGVVCMTGAVEDADSFNPNWECLKSGTRQPTALISAGLNLIAPCPLPDTTGPYSVTLDVAANADIPVNNAAFVQLGKEHLDAILDEAQHLASFKQGGDEFLATVPLHENFVKQAGIYNDRLRGTSTYLDAVQGLSQRQAAKSPRRSSDVEITP
jgi:hypothetical protein